jgi:catechol 2,3-dioxygenase-like lactoylglutathione lyase family enzyme
MSVQLNHTIVWSSNKEHAASFFSEIYGLPEPQPYARFLVVPTANGVSMDFADQDEDWKIDPQHYAFLVSEPEFDAIMERISARGIAYWADPMRKQPGEINRHNDGRGVYFEGPDGHFYEALTVPYGGNSD